MKIGKHELRHGIFLAPMAGYSDRAMRYVCRMAGAEYSVTEMVSAKAVVFGDKKTLTLAGIKEGEGPVALQLFGSEPDTIAKAADILVSGAAGHGSEIPAAIDINMGCPVKKIFSNGEGSALMRDPELIYRIVKATVNATDIPVTVKIRSGITKDSINAPECARAAEEGGASLVTVHGRTREDMYSGLADRGIIAAVKRSVNIPVIANGDVKCGADAVNMLRETGADGVAVGRGAVGNPFVFAEIAAALRGEEYIAPDLTERIEVALTHIRMAVEDKGERVAIPEARKQIAAYFSSFRGAARLRTMINSATTLSEIERIVREIDYENS